MSLKRCSVSDLMGSLTSRTITDEGYMLAPGNLSKAGNVQEYYADELGLEVAGVGKNRIVRMYRPLDEVFHPDALKSFDAKPITLTHPPEKVTADNWKAYAVGEVSGVRAGDGYMSGQLAIRDKAAVAAVIDGSRQLSCGYSFDADMTAGTTPDGQSYDGVMRVIRGNHHAIVDAARGGPGCRVADSNRTTHPPGERTMAMTRKLVINGIPLEVEDNQASLVEKIVDEGKTALKAATDATAVAVKRATDAEAALAAEQAKGAKLVADHAAAVTALQAQIPAPEKLAELAKIVKLTADHAAEITVLKAQIPSAEKIEQLAADRAKVVADGLTLLPGLKPEGKSVPAIRIEVLAGVIAANDSLKRVVQAALGGVEPEKATEAVAKIAFDAVVAVGGAATTDARGSVNDPAVARALALAGRQGNDGAAKPLTGVDVLKYRETHGGKLPPARTSA